MKSSKNILLWFGVIIAVIVVLTVALVLINQSREVTFLPENTPEGVVQRFLLAIQDKDFPKAYSYLNIIEHGTKLSYENWLNYAKPVYATEQSTWRASLISTNITGNTAVVEINIDIFRPNSQPLDNAVYSQRVLYYLSETTNDRWYITSYPELYWLY